MRKILKLFGRTVRSIISGVIELAAIVFLFIGWMMNGIARVLGWLGHKINSIGRAKKTKEEKSAETPT